MDDPKFCQYCGQPTTEYWNKMYDPETGEKVMRRRCVRPECPRGKELLQEQREEACEAEGGHFMGFWESRCSRCGYEWRGF